MSNKKVFRETYLAERAGDKFKVLKFVGHSVTEVRVKAQTKQEATQKAKNLI